MLCTQCSRPIRPVIAVDIDGTLGDYHGHFVKFASAYLGKRLPAAENYQSNKRFAEYLGISLAEYRIIKLAYRQGGMKRSMPIFTGAKPLLRTIEEEGCELWLTTTRPFQRLDNVDPDTRFWLERHDIGFQGLLYDEDKYERLAETVDAERVVMVIDDLSEQCVAAAQHFGQGKVVMFANPHNSWVHNGFRVTHYNLQHLVRQAVSKWREAHVSVHAVVDASV